MSDPSQERNDPMLALKRGFKLIELPRGWKIECKQCKSRWKLTTDEPAIGNVLHLLNHEASHRD
jgi:hypothetical protein